MTVMFHFVCAKPDCRTHVHVTFVCHDDHPYDLNKIGEAFGFRQQKAPLIDRWYCAEHSHE